MSVHKIIFNGVEYLGIGNRNNFAIATREQYENFLPSFAHCKNGEVRRFGVLIGKKEDVVFVGDND